MLIIGTLISMVTAVAVTRALLGVLAGFRWFNNPAFMGASAQKIPAWQRDIYTTVGGAPHLDQNYTVYGEVITGIDMVDRIAAVKKDERDRPIVNLPMTVELLKKSECKQLDKLLGLTQK